MANANFTCTLEAWASGSTIYANMHYYRADGLTYTYQDTSFPTPTMTIAGTSFSDTDFANRVHSGLNVGNVYTTQFSKTVGGDGTYNVSFSAGSGSRSDFAGSWSTTVTVSGQSSPPTGLSASNIRPGVESFTATVSITGWGTGSGSRYRELQCWTYDASSLVSPRRWQPTYGDSFSGDITVDNTSSGTLNITGNTRYTLGVYASNGSVGTDSQRVDNYVTLAYPPAVSATPIDNSSVLMTYSLQADGGFYAKNVQYSLDGGTTWVTGATVNSGSATTGTFTITGLTPGATYTIRTRVSTNAGETDGNNVVFPIPKNNFYGPVAGEATPTTRFYGSSNSQASTVTKLYGSANGQSKLIYQGFGHLQYP